MKKKLFALFFLWGVISLLLQACNYSGTPPLIPPTALTNPEVTTILMQRPLNGSIFSIGALVEMQTLVRSASSLSINEITFLVNGTSIGAADEFQSRNWTPPGPGEYYIQSRAVLSDGAIAISNPVRICVMSLAYGFRSEEGGYLGLCEIPTRIPNAAASGNITINALASPNTISYSPDPACYWNRVDVTFVARVDDPQDLVAFASLELYLNSTTNPFQFFLNWITTRPVNQKEYRTSFNFGPYNLVDIPNGALRWVIKVFGRDGQELQTAEGSIPVQVIECNPQPLQIAPSTAPTGTSTSEILQIVTSTPTPTQRVLYIVSPTKKPKKDNGNSNPPPAPTQPCNPLVRVCP